jgi:hypothetical protein
MPPVQFMNAEKPSMVVYMAKLEGKYAIEAWYIPGLDTMAMRKKIATRGFKVLEKTTSFRRRHRGDQGQSEENRTERSCYL